MSALRVSLALALSMALAIVAAAPAPGFASTAHKHHSGAKISMRTARSTALAKVPGGKLQKSELEREHGKLIYSFDIRVPGQAGIEEVQVDAMNGDVVSQTHESAKAERKEAQQEKAETKTNGAATEKSAGH